MWLMHFRHFVKRDAYVPFEEFFQPAPAEQPQKPMSKDDIMRDVEHIRRMMKGR